MPFCLMPELSLAAVSAVVPGRSVSFEDELSWYGNSGEQAEKAVRLAGVRSRRVAGQGVTASDLCRQAAEKLFRETGIPREDIEVVAFVSQNPDYLLPATASLLQADLGLGGHCAALDMNVGCAGFTHGLWALGSLVSTGACKKALLLVGDTIARFTNPENRVIAPLFGDCGTAAVLERKPGGPGISFLMGNNGAAYEALTIPGGGSRLPQKKDEGPDAPFKQVIRDHNNNPWTLGDYGQLWMDGMAVFGFGVGVVPGHIKEHLRLAGTTAQKLDLLLLHQANRLMLENIAKKVGVAPEKAPMSVLEHYGNLGAASLPALICDTLKGAAPGAGPEHCLLCGFGAGLAWSSCLLSLKDTMALPVAEADEADHSPARDQCIDRWHARFSGSR